MNDTASVTTSASVNIMVRANDSDPDGDPLTVTAVGTWPGHGAEPQDRLRLVLAHGLWLRWPLAADFPGPRPVGNHPGHHHHLRLQSGQPGGGAVAQQRPLRLRRPCEPEPVLCGQRAEPVCDGGGCGLHPRRQRQHDLGRVGDLCL
ncbi:Ig-like domain-containing protein [Brevundimonas sp.]|uniref:Ig-like domain-containing protein n=1 Tax=Brevundimonas sp. TaxID=1871086 RepID=UPI003A5BA414